MAFPRAYPVLFEIISAPAARGHRPVRLIRAPRWSAQSTAGVEEQIRQINGHASRWRPMLHFLMSSAQGDAPGDEVHERVLAKFVCGVRRYGRGALLALRAGNRKCGAGRGG